MHGVLLPDLLYTNECQFPYYHFLEICFQIYSKSWWNVSLALYKMYGADSKGHTVVSPSFKSVDNELWINFITAYSITNFWCTNFFYMFLGSCRSQWWFRSWSHRGQFCIYHCSWIHLRKILCPMVSFLHITTLLTLCMNHLINPFYWQITAVSHHIWVVYHKSWWHC